MSYSPAGDHVDAKQQGSELRVAALEEASGIMKEEEIKEHSQLSEHSLKESKAGDPSSEPHASEDTKEQSTAEEPAKTREPDESRMFEKNEAVLAERLGTQAAVFINSPFGVELILEENSLEQSINAKVVVKPEIRLVKCSCERDTSR